jgi:TolB-like protein
MKTIIGWLMLLSMWSALVASERPELFADRSFKSATAPALTFISIAQQGALEERIGYLSKDISDGLTENRKRTIAVVEFADLKGNVTDFGRFIAEELITRLYQTKKFKVIERQLLNKVIAEQKLSLTGVVEQSSAQRLGKVLGVDAIASGTVTDLGRVLRVNARLIDTATGEIFAVASAEIIKDDAVMNLVGGTNSAPENKPSPSFPNAAPKNVLRATVNDFVFEIVSCKLSKDGVVCEPTVTNSSSEDREIFMNGFGRDISNDCAKTTRAFDEFGNEYTPKYVYLGSVKGDGFDCYSLANTLVPRSPMKVRLAFADVNPEAKMIGLLRVYFVLKDDPRGGKLSVDLRNIPIMR